MAKTIKPVPYPDNHAFSTMAEFGAFIRSARTQQQLRIDDAASLCGVSVQLLSDLENGKDRKIGMPKALQVAQRLGLVMFVMPKERAVSWLSPESSE